MTSTTKVSACVDCGTPMIGGLSRCSACRAAVSRQTSPLAVALGVLGIAVLAIVLLVKGCLS